MRPRLGAFSILIWSVLGASCRQERSVELRDPPPAPTSTDSLPEAPLSGLVNGEPFALGSARYYVDRRPGYERVDIKLLAAKTETPCGAPSSTDLPSVWLRRRGAEKLQPSEARIDAAKGGAWEIHYQLQSDKRWVGSGETNALLVIREVGPDLTIEGELSACFRDEKGSCVAGRFSAHYCDIRIDSPVRGTKNMERSIPRGKRKWLLDGSAAGATVAGELEGPRELVLEQPGGTNGTVTIESREQLLPTYPCSACHAQLPSRPNRRKLVEFHVVRSDDFSHGEDAFWCHQCHSRENMDLLVTAAGRLITFNEAYLICISCHGDKAEDYRTGVHGLTTGYWLGEKHRRSCTACHDPHNPLYPTIEPEEPPAKVRGTDHHQ